MDVSSRVVVVFGDGVPSMDVSSRDVVVFGDGVPSMDVSSRVVFGDGGSGVAAAIKREDCGCWF